MLIKKQRRKFNLAMQNISWLKKGPSNDVVVNSFATFFRSIPNLAYKKSVTPYLPNELEDLAQQCSSLFLDKKATPKKFSELLEPYRLFLQKAMLIPMESDKNSLHIIDIKNALSLSFNTSEHIEITQLKNALNLGKLYESISEIDKKINKYTPYAFSKKYGHLTSNIMHGSSAFFMGAILFLPMFVLKNKQIDKMINKDDFLKCSQTFNECIKSDSNFFIIKNTFSPSLSENEIIFNLHKKITEIVKMERALREDYYCDNKIVIEDQIMKSVGFIEHSLLLSQPEALVHLSNIRLGIILGLIKNLKIYNIDKLIYFSQKDFLVLDYKKKFLTKIEEDKFRAKFVKDFIGNFT